MAHVVSKLGRRFAHTQGSCSACLWASRFDCHAIVCYAACVPPCISLARFCPGPFIVGVTMASENIRELLRYKQMCGLLDDYICDAPGKGDPHFSMTISHGDKWIPWQELWVKGA